MSNNTKWPVVSYFMNADEIAAHVVKTLGEVDGKFFYENSNPDTRSIDAVFAFMSLGRWVRNTYHLWHPDNPHTTMKHVPVLINGVDHSEFHPDNFSAMIIEKVLKDLEQKYSPDALMVKQLKDLGLVT